MRKIIAQSVLALFSGIIVVTPSIAADSPPAWAYPLDTTFKPRTEDGIAKRVPGSAATYSITQLRDRFIAPVWHPNEHPAMPPIVAEGRKPNVFACGFCHRSDGPGGPENSSLTGLPAAYFIQQMADYKSGTRRTAVPKRNIDLMIALSKDISDAEVAEAAAYFAALKPRNNLKVVETDTVPKTFIAGTFFVDAKNGEKEPIGQRIIEVPDDFEQFENRDPRSRFTVYAPKGSLAKGEALVNTGGAGKTMACATCHGQDLKGLGNVPSIAGRSPSYIARQLYDMQSGARAGTESQLMKPVVINLTNDDMVSIVAYLASRPR